mgnify:CR=1 FL=1
MLPILGRKDLFLSLPHQVLVNYKQTLKFYAKFDLLKTAELMLYEEMVKSLALANQFHNFLLRLALGKMLLVTAQANVLD